jgi:hypothetical protein
MSELRNVHTARLVGLTALAFSALYVRSDVIEAIQGGCSDGQLQTFCGRRRSASERLALAPRLRPRLRARNGAPPRYSFAPASRFLGE